MKRHIQLNCLNNSERRDFLRSSPRSQPSFVQFFDLLPTFTDWFTCVRCILFTVQQYYFSLHLQSKTWSIVIMSHYYPLWHARGRIKENQVWLKVTAVCIKNQGEQSGQRVISFSVCISSHRASDLHFCCRFLLPITSLMFSRIQLRHRNTAIIQSVSPHSGGVFESQPSPSIKLGMRENIPMACCVPKVSHEINEGSHM